MDELSIEIVDHSTDFWRNKLVWNRRVWLILFDNMEINVVKVVSNSCFDDENVALRVEEGEIWESFMGVPKEATIKFQALR